MKKYYKLFIASLLIVVFIHNISAQVQSVMGEFSPSSSTLIGSASRIGYDDDYWTTYYMRYSDNV